MLETPEASRPGVSRQDSNRKQANTGSRGIRGPSKKWRRLSAKHQVRSFAKIEDINTLG